jgi:hypothetical protein
MRLRWSGLYVNMATVTWDGKEPMYDFSLICIPSNTNLSSAQLRSASARHRTQIVMIHPLKWLFSTGQLSLLVKRQPTMRKSQKSAHAH